MSLNNFFCLLFELLSSIKAYFQLGRICWERTTASDDKYYASSDQ